MNYVGTFPLSSGNKTSSQYIFLIFFIFGTCPLLTASQMSGTILMLWQSINTTMRAMRTNEAFFSRLKHDLEVPVMVVDL